MRVRLTGSKRFGAHCAVDRIDSNVEKRRNVWCCSPVRCGKTELLRLLAGLERLDSGAI